MFQISTLANGVLWTAFPKQEEVLSRNENEILFGGARGGAKTACGIAWLIRGNNPEHKVGHICDQSYVLHQFYRALVLRRNLTDMGDWIAKAKRLYAPLGGEYRPRDNEFLFPSGAAIVIGHLDDEDAYEKYQGQEFARILIEELTQVPTYELYARVLGSLRSPHKEMQRQFFGTANPGGRGHAWVKAHWIDVAPSGTPYIDPETTLSRIFIPAGIKDNPIYQQDRQYVGQLMALPPMIRRAWLDGDWSAIAGEAFSEFRIRPSEGEPPEAQHVVESTSVPNAPWFHRWLSCDWGYSHNAAVYKFIEFPDEQVHVADELVMSQTTPEELGVEIARFAWHDLTSGNGTQTTMDLYLSPDAFARRSDEKTIADQIAEGIQQVLGPDSVYIPPASTPNERPEGIFQRAELAHRASIVIQRASNQRVAGWMYVRTFLRWWPMLPPNTDSWNPEYALQLQREDPIKFGEYAKLFQPRKEILPKLRIYGDKCPRLVAAIPLARMNDPSRRGGDPNDIDKAHFDGMDSIDSLRYGLMGFRTMVRPMPREEFIRRHMEKYTPANPANTDMRWIAMKVEKDYKDKYEGDGKPIYFHRSASRAGRFRPPPGR